MELTTLRFTGPVPADSRPMTYGGFNKYMNAAAEIGRNLVSKHQVQPEYGDEQADAGRDYRTRLARPNHRARTRTGKNIIFLSN